MVAYNQRKRRASAFAELLVAVVAMFVLFVLVADLGRVIAVKSALTAAASNGAITGANSSIPATASPQWSANVESAVVGQMGNYDWFSPAELTVATPAVVSHNGQSCVSVLVSYRFQAVYSLNGLIDTITVSQSATHPIVR